MNDSDKQGLLGDQWVDVVAFSSMAISWSIHNVHSLFDPNLGAHKLWVINQTDNYLSCHPVNMDTLNM